MMNYRIWIFLFLIVTYSITPAQEKENKSNNSESFGMLKAQLDSCRAAMLLTLNNDSNYKIAKGKELANLSKVATREDVILKETLQIIDYYDTKVNDTSLVKYRADVIGLCQKVKYKYLRVYLAKAPVSEYSYIKNIVLPQLDRKLPYDEVVLINSSNIIDYLMEKERVLSILNYQGNPDPLLCYGGIKARYKGQMRDVLISKLLLTFYAKADLEQWTTLATDALTYMATAPHKIMLEKKLDQNGLGKLAFDFALPDTSGNIIRLSNLKGKIVVVDFWFTGCSACKILAKALKQVAEIYKDEPRLVFVSVNVDTDRNRWLHSVKGGDYTGEETINLFTEGQGYRHPLIQHYGFSGFPNLLLIDKDSRLVAIPPRPETQENFAVFKEMVDSLL